MFRKLSVLLLSSLLLSTSLHAYKNKNAILLLNKDLQHDSLGYNFVSSFLKWSYYNLKKGNIRLYDSPLKINEIGFLSLQSMEENNDVRFTEANNLFIYELWSSDNNSTSFSIRGFTVTAESKSKEEISLGFISYDEIIDLLKIARVIPGIDASYAHSFYEVLMNKQYSYDLIFFDDEPIIKPNSKDPERDYLKGNNIKMKAFNPSKKNLNAVKVKQLKKIKYAIRKNDYDPLSIAILKSLEDYFDKHKRYILHLGGEELYGYFKYTRSFISRCEVTEMLYKEGNKLKRQLVKVQPFSFNLPYFPMEKVILDTLDLYIDGYSIESILLEKEYRLHLLEINDVEVDEALTELYMQAILRGNWRKLSAIKP
jgi:hypothetical protein